MINDEKIKPQNSDNNKIITFIGMMGAGKSKFGRLIANDLNYVFHDTDSIIEKNCNITIRDMFLYNGEKFFRKVEQSTIKELILNILQSNQNSVVSIGGGAFDNLYTRKLLLKNTRVIWLNTPINILVNRVGDGSKRPMIKGNIKKSISELLNKRIQYYSLCHDQLDTVNLNQNQIVEKINKIIFN